MPRDVPIGNGSLLVCFDFDYRIRDLYYPRVGKENHAMGSPSRFGVWVNGVFSWLGRNEWRIQRDYLDDTLVTSVTADSKRLPVQLRFNDTVDYDKNLLLRRVTVRNLANHPIHVRLFFHNDLNILENESGDTVFFDPRNAALVHYKGPRYFMVSCATERALGVSHFATGVARHRGLEGTWKDAEGGELSGNPIAQGVVDSVVGVHLSPAAGEEAICHYWVGVGCSYQEAEQLHRFVMDRGVDWLIERNTHYWRRWLSAARWNLDTLPEPVARQYKRSLLIIRTQVDHGGAIIAANDSDIWQFNQDTYSYMWPRDGAIVAQTLDRAGYGELARRFLEFCTHKVLTFNYSASILSQAGFLMHKYNPDGSVGSSWQPWFSGGEMQFPIQEDETALVLWAIWNHYLLHRDMDIIRGLYRPFVENAAEFLLDFRDDKTGLPLPSFDLWEEQRGVFSFTVATVIAGLESAARLAALFSEDSKSAAYRRGARQVRAAMERHLFYEQEGRYVRAILFEGGMQRRDASLDASLLGLPIFGGFAVTDPRVAATAAAVEKKLWVGGSIGGLARYEGDNYQRADAAAGIPGNPWILCTLWLAQYKSARAANATELDRVLKLLTWAVERALPSGVLAEQVNPATGEALSVSPLTWSHAGFVAAVLDYMERMASLTGGDAGR